MVKKILQTGITGQQGVNLVENVVLKMGFLWHATGVLEAGNDGFIEIRDSTSGEVTNSIGTVRNPPGPQAESTHFCSSRRTGLAF